jgi:hypothetical protein
MKVKVLYRNKRYGKWIEDEVSIPDDTEKENKKDTVQAELERKTDMPVTELKMLGR